MSKRQPINTYFNQKKYILFRHDMHAHPELAFEESRTAEFVANQLESYGIQVTRGIGKTGVVGTLTKGSSTKSIGLRADMDALAIQEVNNFPHKSKISGCMHGCGHDGHTVMLLAAAEYLSREASFDGTVRFIFQPAEEANAIGSGAKAMIDDELFTRFPVDCVFALHNAPDFYIGAIATRPGVCTASMDQFEVVVQGKGGHGAWPHLANDPLVIGAQLVGAWQTILSRNVDADESAVVSATSFNTPDSYNVIPDTVVIKGSVRTRSADIRDDIEHRFKRMTEGIIEGFGARSEVNYRRMYPSCINDKAQTLFVSEVAETVFGCDRVLDNMPIAGCMGSEDFAYMLAEVPGCYFLIGAGKKLDDIDPVTGKDIRKEEDQGSFECKGAPLLHHPEYDFNDDIIPYGATMFARLAEYYLV